MSGSKSFDVSANGSTVVFLRGHPRNDAVRVDTDGTSGTTGTDVTIGVHTNDEFDDISFGDTTTVESVSGDGFDGSTAASTTALARTVAVEINETSGGGNAAGTVVLHGEDDPAENGEAFASR
jgi:hypothetical protein